MNFWQHLQTAAGMGRAMPWVALVFIVGALILLILRPVERMRIRTAILLFAISLIGLLAAAALLSSGVNSANSSYKWVTWVSRLLLWVAFVNVASVFIFEILLDALRLKPPRIMRDLLIALTYIVVAITILSRDVDLTGIIATSAVLTAIIGLSFQDTLGNMMGGMALQMERTIGVGDWIKFDGQEGLVRDIRWRHTSIETRNWDTIVIPNSALMKSQVTVLGRRAGQPRQHRQWVYFNVDFRYSPADVTSIVETALRAEPIPSPGAAAELRLDGLQRELWQLRRALLADRSGGRRSDKFDRAHAYLFRLAPGRHSTFDSSSFTICYGGGSNTS
jgi:small-conductance mechanosensitive channel